MPSRKEKHESLPEVPGPDAQVEPTSAGDGGAREAEVETAIDRIEAMADQINLGEDGKALVARTTAFLVDLFKSRPKPWGQLGQREQRDLGKALEHNAKELVREIVETVGRDQKPAIRAMLESYTEKDGIKATLKVRPASEAEELAAVVGLHKARGKVVLITVASADDYSVEPAADQSEPDQPLLGFEAGSDSVDASGPEFLTTGATTQLEGLTHAVRIDLKSGMAQARPLGDYLDDEDGWVDLREATPVELAHERDRIADFDQEEQEAEAEQA